MSLLEVTQQMTREDLKSKKGVFYNPASTSFKRRDYDETARYEAAEAEIAEHGQESTGMILFADCSKFAPYFPDMKSAIFWLGE